MQNVVFIVVRNLSTGGIRWSWSLPDLSFIDGQVLSWEPSPQTEIFQVMKIQFKPMNDDAYINSLDFLSLSISINQNTLNV